MAGTRNNHVLVRALILCALAITAFSAAPSTASAATGGVKQPGSRDACPATPVSFSAGAGQFTMMIRINQMDNVKTWTNFNSATGGLAGRVQVNDIFVINARFEQTTPAVAEQIAAQLRATFPCNRIISLNGLSPNPALPGYILTLVNSPSGIYSVMLDYEQMDWDEARAQGAVLPTWTQVFPTNLPRFGSFNQALSNALAVGPNAFARTGAAPIDISTWNYGQFAQTVDAANQRLGARHLGLQSVQTQASCAGGATAFGTRLGELYKQYKFRLKIKKKKVRRKGKIVKKKIKRMVKIKQAARPNLLNLAAQISFSDTPVPGDPLPVRSTSAALADQCVAAGLARGQSAFFFFASSDSMKLLFQQPTMATLRPSFT